jgi:hypothetical protein
MKERGKGCKELASLKFIGHVGRLEIQTRVDIVVLTLKSEGQANTLEIQAEFLCCNLEAEVLHLLETLALYLNL